MASKSKTTKHRRKLRRKKMGADRKAQVRTNGTTPAFAVHTPEADANAPNQVAPSAAQD